MKHDQIKGSVIMGKSIIFTGYTLILNEALIDPSNGDIYTLGSHDHQTIKFQPANTNKDGILLKFNSNLDF